uniref:uncharacterized protein LOC122583041 n=1 Tax=Erigeron canadensis TaxID=72917 RepID=UPI001CB8CA38|nr:uncharacterized protein LOC122583041 [Erigeron canadensis]
MAIGTPKPSPLHVTFLTLILLTTPSPSSSFIIPPPHSFHTLFYLSHSLLTRVANLRATRGDISGSARVKTLANKIDFGFEMFQVVSDINELMKGLIELSRLESRADLVEWVRRNYRSLLKGFMSLSRLLKVFPHSVDKYMKVIRYNLEFIQEIQNKGVLQIQGPLKDVVALVRAEIVYGGLLEDCLELGSSDIKGVIQILIDVALQYTSNGKSEL